MEPNATVESQTSRAFFPSAIAGRASFAAPMPKANPRIPARRLTSRASRRMIRMMWLLLKPMARKTPISVIRSLTLPILVTKTIG